MALFAKKTYGIVPDDRLQIVTAEPTAPKAERQRVIELVFGFTGGRPSLLAKWIVRRENQYFTGPAKRWNLKGDRDDLVAYAACRDYLKWYEERKRANVAPGGGRTREIHRVVEDKAEARHLGGPDRDEVQL